MKIPGQEGTLRPCPISSFLARMPGTARRGSGWLSSGAGPGRSGSVNGLIAAVVTAASSAVFPVPASAAPASAAPAVAISYRCFHVAAPYESHATGGGCRPGRVKVTLNAGTTQVLTVTNTNQDSTFASFNGFSLTGGRWIHRWGPWTARIGENGFASPGKKAEGDGRTPQGSYGFQFMFGVNANPGVHFPWQQAYSYDYWDDDPASPRYNLWTDTRLDSAGTGPEPMYNVPAYNYSAVIGYNLARTPGAGSAIFFHVGSSSPTAGCVSLAQANLLQILLWLRPGGSPVITMSVIAK